MKKIASVMLVALLVISLLAIGAVAESVDFEGVWVLDYMIFRGIMMDGSAPELNGKSEIIFTLNADGTASVMNFGEASSSGTWSASGNTVNLEMMNDTLAFVLQENGSLAADMGNGDKLVLRREGMEGSIPLAYDVNPNPVGPDNDVTGTWYPVYIIVNGVKESVQALGDVVTFILYSDGSALGILGLQSANISWSQSGDEITINGVGGPLNATVVDGNLHIDMTGGFIIYYRNGSPID